MEKIKINLKKINKSHLNIIEEALRAGKVCILPSDTSYGLCARADANQAIEKIYKIKQREKNKPLSVFVGGLEMIKKVAQVSKINGKLLKKYLPGSYTFVLPKKEGVLEKISPNNKIGVRYIESELFRKLFKRIDFPITATSANLTNEAPLYDPNEIEKIFKSSVQAPDLLVDAGQLIKIVPSTIIDLTNKKPLLLRQGEEKFLDA